MWFLTMLINCIIMVLLWLLSEVAITPAYNFLVQYADTRMAIPLLTDLAFDIRYYGRFIPFTWIIITLFWGLRLRNYLKDERSESLSMHISLTICIGLAPLVFFAIAGILPILKISAIVN